MPHQIRTQLEAQIMFAFRTISTERRQELAVALVERFAGVTAAPVTTIIVGTEAVNDQLQPSRPHP